MNTDASSLDRTVTLAEFQRVGFTLDHWYSAHFGRRDTTWRDICAALVKDAAKGYHVYVWMLHTKMVPQDIREITNAVHDEATRQYNDEKDAAEREFQDRMDAAGKAYHATMLAALAQMGAERKP